jgi:hypothetical protein
MVMHKRHDSPARTLCGAFPRPASDSIADHSENVDCEACIRGAPVTHNNLFATSQDTAWRSDLLTLLARARSQGVRSLEVRADGSFVAVMDAAVPEPRPARPGMDPKPPTPEDEAAQREADLYTRHAR